MNIVQEALESAAEADDPGIRGYGGAGTRATSSRRRIWAVRNSIRRFLENLPGEMTVVEIMHRMEEEEEHDDA